jgi:hypothetical protein
VQLRHELNPYQSSFTGLTYFAGFTWAIWNTRNKMRTQKIFPDKSLHVIQLGLSFVQKWKILMKTMEKAHEEKMVDLVLKFMEEFQPMNSNPSDVSVM